MYDAPCQPVLILASQSPRRRDLLKQAGFTFAVEEPNIEEIPRPRETPAAFARRAAREKAQAVRGRLPPPDRGIRHIIGCDTVVAVGASILGKPADPEDAVAMLRRLSGRTHAVLTGLCVLTEQPGTRLRRRIRLARTDVRFRRVPEAEIRRYVESGEPMDKAGAYAIQGGAAGMVRCIRGSYTNVVGLPLAELIELIADPPVPNAGCSSHDESL